MCSKPDARHASVFSKLKLVVFLVTCSLSTIAAADPKNAEQALRTELKMGLKFGMPSLSVAIATKQGIVWSGTVGYADIQAHRPARSSDMYGIGSITKMFVACVLEQLADEKMVDLNRTPVDILGSEVMRGIPNADTATLHQLMNHTGGIPSWEFDEDWIRQGRGREIQLDHIWQKEGTLDYIRAPRHPALNVPGEGYSYSNSNYTVLGLVVEKITGKNLVDVLRERIFHPLNLEHIKLEGFEPVDASMTPSRYQFATPDFIRDAGLHPSFIRVAPTIVDVSKTNLSTEWAAGGLLATAEDLALFARDLRDGRVVPPETLQRMLTFRSTDDKDEDAGEGIFRDRYGNETLIGYTGNVLGFGTAVGWLEDTDMVLVIMTNIGAMHAGEAAWYPEKLLKSTKIIARARQLVREKTKLSNPSK